VGPEAQHVPVEPEAAPVVAAAADPTTGSADDFRRIQGIGPKMAAALQDAGIRTYRQLADLDEATLRETIRSAGLRAAPSLATWPQQAKVLVGAPAEADRVLPAGDADA
ncbi:helix-hairpin-helix domain-containing protein, partial [Micromonospora carbonacea]